MVMCANGYVVHDTINKRGRPWQFAKLASIDTAPDPPSNGYPCVRAPGSPGTATIAVGAPSPPAADG